MNSRSSTFDATRDVTQAGNAAHDPSSPANNGVSPGDSKTESEFLDELRGLLQRPSDRSRVIRRAVERYQCMGEQGEKPTIEGFCDPLKTLGGSMYSSIVRELEFAQYLHQHPRVMEAEELLPWPEIDDEVHGFIVEEELGRGGVGRVYLCRDTTLRDRRVVAKLSFRRTDEADTLANLNHPHIIAIHQFLQPNEDGMAGIVMPFLGRSTLDELWQIAFRFGPPESAEVILEAANCWTLPEERSAYTGVENSFDWRGDYVSGILGIGIKIAEALAYANSRGIIHGDVKPSNILLTPQGTPILIDFNLSHDAELDLQLRGGTLPYMSPEQILALTRSPDDPVVTYDSRTDVYALGVLLYQLLCGQVPFDAGRFGYLGKEAARELIEARRYEPRSIDNRNPSVRREFAELIRKCIRFAPEDRYASIAELRDALVNEQQSQQLAENQRKAALRRQQRRRRVLVGLMVLAAAISFALRLRPAEYERTASRALEAAKRGQLNQAAELFDVAVRQNPQYIPARYARAQILITLGRFHEVTNDSASLSNTAKHPQLRALIAYSWSTQDRHVTAAREYRHALRDGLRTATGYNNLGYAMFMSASSMAKPSQFQMAALEHYERALELNPVHEPARINMVEAMLALAETLDEATISEVDKLVNSLLDQHSSDPAYYVWATELFLPISQASDRCRRIITLANQRRVRLPLRRVEKWLESELAVNDAEYRDQLTAAIAKSESFVTVADVKHTSDPRYDSVQDVTVLGDLTL